MLIQNSFGPSTWILVFMFQTAPGLELTNTNGDWCRAPSNTGTFTVIIGDMMERFTNGHYMAIGHRIDNTAWTRHSIVLFFAIDGDYEVSPLPRYCCAERLARYGAITQDQHIENQLRRASENSA